MKKWFTFYKLNGSKTFEKREVGENNRPMLTLVEPLDIDMIADGFDTKWIFVDGSWKIDKINPVSYTYLKFFKPATISDWQFTNAVNLYNESKLGKQDLDISYFPKPEDVLIPIKNLEAFWDRVVD